MKFNRLLTIVFLLQRYQHLTVSELAQRLQVSERTLYRDMNDLSLAGVPLYAEGGPGGGYSLLPEYRLYALGLSEAEIGALFFSEVSTSFTELGLRTARDVAFAKILASLPASSKELAVGVQDRLHIDPSGWNFPQDRTPHLSTIQDAVWQSHRLSLIYRQESGKIITPIVDPLGLVAKAGIWYLIGVAHGKTRPFRVARIQQAVVMQETFERPAGFHLSIYWAEWCARFVPCCPVTLRISPEIVPGLLRLFGEALYERLLPSESTDDSGWRTVSLTFETFETARTAILGFGPYAEVIEPAVLREGVIAYATGLLSRYKQREEGSGEQCLPADTSNNGLKIISKKEEEKQL